jgi:hypothetical protein
MAGVGLTGKIVPLNGGNFPVFEDIFGQGGLRTVQTIAERNLLVTTGSAFCKEGMLVYVRDTKCIYILNAGLASWTFLAPSPALQAQAAWAVDAAAGSDTNTGLPGAPLQTLEELTRRLCPFGRACGVSTNVTVTIAPGRYGALDLLLAQAEPFVGTFNVNCVFASVATTLTSVINTVPGVSQGRITVAAGPINVFHPRIRATNQAAITYIEGVNSATDAFVKTWYPVADNGVPVNIPNGAPVTIETVGADDVGVPGVVIERVNVRVICSTRNDLRFSLNNAEFANGVSVVGINNTPLLQGCKASTAGTTQNYRGNFRAVNCQLGDVVVNGFEQGPIAIVGCSMSAVDVMFGQVDVDASLLALADSIVRSGGHLTVTRGEFTGNLGLDSKLFTVLEGGRCVLGGLFKSGAGNAADYLFDVRSGGKAFYDTVAGISLPVGNADQNLVSGHPATYALLPRCYARADACIALSGPDATATITP